MKVLKTILNTIINVLIVLVLITSILIAVMAISSKATGVSTVFGFTIQTIQSDSMKGGSPDGYEGGDFEKGDVVIGKATKFNEFLTYEKGDIITYTAQDDDGKDFLEAHRIIDVYETPEGILTYQTQGDNREMAEVPDQNDVKDYLPAYRIASIIYSNDYHGLKIKGIGNFLNFIQTQLGFFLVVLLPMIVFFLYELIRVVLNASSYKKEKFKEEKEQAVQEAEADKQAAIDAAVAEALKKQGAPAGDNSPAAESAASPADDFPEMTAEDYEEFKQFQAFKKMQEEKKDE